MATSSIELSLSALRALVFGAEDLEHIAPKSKAAGDTAKVEIIPTQIAEVISSCDPDQEIFHVELYPESHGELWLAFEWRESNARRSRIEKASAEHRQTYEVQKVKLAQITAHISAKFEIKGVKMEETYISFLANQILTKGLSGKAAFIVDLLGIKELVESIHEKESQTTARAPEKDNDNSIA